MELCSTNFLIDLPIIGKTTQLFVYYMRLTSVNQDVPGQ